MGPKVRLSINRHMTNIPNYLPNRFGQNTFWFLSTMKDFLLQPNKDDTDAEIEKIKAEIEMEQKSKGTIGEFSSVHVDSTRIMFSLVFGLIWCLYSNNKFVNHGLLWLNKLRAGTFLQLQLKVSKPTRISPRLPIGQEWHSSGFIYCQTKWTHEYVPFRPIRILEIH